MQIRFCESATPLINLRLLITMVLHQIFHPSTDPAFNLALDDFMLTFPGFADRNIFRLWQNRPAIIIGTHQFPENEVNAPFCRENNIGVYRRCTGGGAVYHDLGNLNFSIVTSLMNPDDAYPFVHSFFADAFHTLGIPATLSPTNDMLIDGCKFSGMAVRRTECRTLVHGTLLFDVDFATLAKALDNAAGKFNKPKGVKSRHAQVANLKAYLATHPTATSPALQTAQDFQTALQRALEATHTFHPQPLTEANLANIRLSATTTYAPLPF